jgi:hypothetical protein
MTRFALLLSLLAVGAFGLVACDDDETSTAETEMITSNFGQDPPGRGPVVVAGGPNACADYRRGPGDIVYGIDVLRGVVRCREARRVLRGYGHDSDTPPWSCQDYGEAMVQCELPGVGAFVANLYCSAPTRGDRAVCPGFQPP